MIMGLRGRGSIWRGGGRVWIGMLSRGMGSLMRLEDGEGGDWGWDRGRGVILGLGGGDVEGKCEGINSVRSMALICMKLLYRLYRAQESVQYQSTRNQDLHVKTPITAPPTLLHESLQQYQKALKPPSLTFPLSQSQYSPAYH